MALSSDSIHNCKHKECVITAETLLRFLRNPELMKKGKDTQCFQAQTRSEVTVAQCWSQGFAEESSPRAEAAAPVSGGYLFKNNELLEDQ